MSQAKRSTDELRSAYIRQRTLESGGGVDREAILHRRRKTAMISLLSEFERDIEPFIRDKQVKERFKRSCREKINGLTFEAIELIRLGPGEHLNAHAVDLAEKLAFDANGGQTRP